VVIKNFRFGTSSFSAIKIHGVVSGHHVVWAMASSVLDEQCSAGHPKMEVVWSSEIVPLYHDVIYAEHNFNAVRFKVLAVVVLKIKVFQEVILS
jgi:hypothetical protein